MTLLEQAESWAVIVTAIVVLAAFVMRLFKADVTGLAPSIAQLGKQLESTQDELADVRQRNFDLHSLVKQRLDAGSESQTTQMDHMGKLAEITRGLAEAQEASTKRASSTEDCIEALFGMVKLLSESANGSLELHGRALKTDIALGERIVELEKKIDRQFPED